MSVSDKLLLRKRAIIETVNDELKNIAQVEHSRHRSFDNFIVNILGAIAAYCMFPKSRVSMYNVHLTHSLLCFEFVEFTLNFFRKAFLPHSDGLFGAMAQQCRQASRRPAARRPCHPRAAGPPPWLPPSRKTGPQCRRHCGPASTVNAVTAPSCRAWAFSGRTWGWLRPPTQGPAAAVAHLARYFSACERMSSTSSK